MNTHKGLPTQVAHPWKATLRTVVAYVVAVVPVLLVAIPVVQDELGPYLPDAWVAWLGGVVAVLGAIVAAATRIMALEAVQDLLARIGLGTGVEKE
ncbi:hypothetical protein GCM10009592_26400 [Brachybacterium rhamnosum]|uniref:Holin n=1 Tax=Brachybacterium rhamnosum TaxID=173361 RepID=A0ABW4Q2P1_9MICO